MSGFEWFLLVVVVILVPLVVAVAITLWTLEMARQRKRQNRAPVDPNAAPVKRKATRETPTVDETVTGHAGSEIGAASVGVGVPAVADLSVSSPEDEVPRGDLDVSGVVEDPGTTEPVADSGAPESGSPDSGNSSNADSVGSSST